MLSWISNPYTIIPKVDLHTNHPNLWQVYLKHTTHIQTRTHFLWRTIIELNRRLVELIGKTKWPHRLDKPHGDIPTHTHTHTTGTYVISIQHSPILRYTLPCQYKNNLPFLTSLNIPLLSQHDHTYSPISMKHTGWHRTHLILISKKYPYPQLA